MNVKLEYMVNLVQQSSGTTRRCKPVSCLQSRVLPRWRPSLGTRSGWLRRCHSGSSGPGPPSCRTWPQRLCGCPDSAPHSLDTALTWSGSRRAHGVAWWSPRRSLARPGGSGLQEENKIKITTPGSKFSQQEATLYPVVVHGVGTSLWSIRLLKVLQLLQQLSAETPLKHWEAVDSLCSHDLRSIKNKDTE